MCCCVMRCCNTRWCCVSSRVVCTTGVSDVIKTGHVEITVRNHYSFTSESEFSYVVSLLHEEQYILSEDHFKSVFYIRLIMLFQGENTWWGGCISTTRPGNSWIDLYVMDVKSYRVKCNCAPKLILLNWSILWTHSATDNWRIIYTIGYLKEIECNSVTSQQILWFLHLLSPSQSLNVLFLPTEWICVWTFTIRYMCDLTCIIYIRNFKNYKGQPLYDKEQLIYLVFTSQVILCCFGPSQSKESIVLNVLIYMWEQHVVGLAYTSTVIRIQCKTNSPKWISITHPLCRFTETDDHWLLPEAWSPIRRHPSNDRWGLHEHRHQHHCGCGRPPLHHILVSAGSPS